MNRHSRRLLWLLATLALAPAPLGAQELQISFKDGRVTLVAANVGLREIMAEWASVGGTAISGGDALAGSAVALELRDVPESAALQQLLQSASGYVAAPRRAALPGTSHFDRIVIVATSRAPETPPPAVDRRPQPRINVAEEPAPNQEPLVLTVTPSAPPPAPATPGNPFAPTPAPANPGNPFAPSAAVPQGPTIELVPRSGEK